VPSKRILRRAAAAAAALVPLVGIAGGCSSGSPTTNASAPASSSSAPPSAAGTTITIKDFVFSPTPLNAKVGDTVTVTNQDDADHELKANDGSFDAGRFAKGSKTFTVTKAGTFAYHCDVHDYMTGVIQVSGS
jgi:plastocyanin